MKGRVATAREFLAKGDHQGYDRTKRGLPGICFMANFAPNKGKEGKFREDTWRLQSAAKLTGLIMLDYDHIEFPARDFMDRIPEHMFADDCDSQVLYVGRPSAAKRLAAASASSVRLTSSEATSPTTSSISRASSR